MAEIDVACATEEETISVDACRSRENANGFRLVNEPAEFAGFLMENDFQIHLRGLARASIKDELNADGVNQLIPAYLYDLSILNTHTVSDQETTRKSDFRNPIFDCPLFGAVELFKSRKRHSRWSLFSLIICLVLSLGKCAKPANSFCRCEKFSINDRPFVAIWNSPTIGCQVNFSEPIRLAPFGILENDHQTWDGRYVTVFSRAQLGFYPYFVSDGDQNYNGGLPQVVDLGQHLRKARLDIVSKIPDPNYNGLAVIDWEEWRPLWDRNWDSKRVYKVRSVDLVRSQNPTWTLKRLLETAKRDFETSARAMFEHTITLGKQLRPRAFWGFYGFPDNYGKADNQFQPSAQVQAQNDELEWLFSASTAMYPSIYLMDDRPDNRNFVLGRLREALRFTDRGKGLRKSNIPIFVYFRAIYENHPNEFRFLKERDLENTIGVAADIGASGIVIWGNRFDENTSPYVCRRIDEFVKYQLGPFLQNKVKQVESCSVNRCRRRGHCVDRSLLTLPLLRKYQLDQSLSQCTDHGANVSPVERKSTVLAPSDAREEGIKAGVSSGWTHDLGVQHVNRSHISDSVAEAFFDQLSDAAGSGSSLIETTGAGPNTIKRTVLPDPLSHTGQLHAATGHLNGSILSRGVVAHVLDKQQNTRKSIIPHAHHINNHSNMSNASAMQLQAHLPESHAAFANMKAKSGIGRTELAHTTRVNTTSSDVPDRKKSKIPDPIEAPSYKVPDPAAASSQRRARKTWLPHMYVILIGVSIGGALMFSVVFVAVYYYISLRNAFPDSKNSSGDNEEKDFVFTDPREEHPPNGHSSPVPFSGDKGHVRKESRHQKRSRTEQ